MVSNHGSAGMRYKAIEGDDYADDGSPQAKLLFHPIATGPSAEGSRRISWGEPAQLAQVQFDRCCPSCGAVQGPGYIRQDGTLQVGDLDLGIEGGRVFGARCPCGWSF